MYLSPLALSYVADRTHVMRSVEIKYYPHSGPLTLPSCTHQNSVQDPPDHIHSSPCPGTILYFWTYNQILNDYSGLRFPSPWTRWWLTILCCCDQKRISVHFVCVNECHQLIIMTLLTLYKIALNPRWDISVLIFPAWTSEPKFRDRTSSCYYFRGDTWTDNIDLWQHYCT